MSEKIITYTRHILFVICIFCAIVSQATENSILEDETVAPKPVVKLTAEEQNWIAQHSSFSAAGHLVAPYIVNENGKPSGYTIQLLQEICGLVGLRPEFHILTTQAMNEGLRNATIDMGMLQVYSAKRDSWLEYSKQSVPIIPTIFTQTGRTDISDLASLKGKTIATIKGNAINTLLQKYLPEAIILHATDYAELFHLVGDGKADATILERQTAEFHLRQNFISNVHAIANVRFGDRPTLQAHHYAVREELPLLSSILDKGFEALPTIQKDRLWNHWFGNKKDKSTSLKLTSEEQSWLREHPVVRARIGNFPPLSLLG